MVVFVVKDEYDREEVEEILQREANISFRECDKFEQAIGQSKEIINEEGTIIILSLKEKKKSHSTLQVQTFGNFEVFYKGKPVFFTRTKSKELLAYLIDRRGASVSTSEACSVLWEAKEYNFSLQRQFQTVVSDLKKALKKCNCAQVLCKNRNSISVNTAWLDCDVYKLMEGDKVVMEQYHGEYMSNYSWAELTAGYLAMKYGYSKSGQ